MTATKTIKDQTAAHFEDAVIATGGTKKTCADAVDRANAKLYVWPKAAADGMAATTTAATLFGQTSKIGKVTEAYITPDSTLTSDNTDYATITVKKLTADGATAATVASVTTKLAASGGSGNWVQYVKVPLTLASADLSVEAGGAFTVEIAKAGAGVIVPVSFLTLVISDD